MVKICVMLRKTLASLKCTAKEVSFELSHRRFRPQTQKFEPPYSRLHLTEACKTNIKIPFNGQYTRTLQYWIQMPSLDLTPASCFYNWKTVYGVSEDKIILYCLGYCFHEISFFIDQCLDFALFRTAFLFLRWLRRNWIEDMDLVSLIQN